MITREDILIALFRDPLLPQVDQKTSQLLGYMEKIMTSLDVIIARVADLTSKVTAATTLDASVAILIQEQVVQLQTLADQIAALQANTVTQEQIDGLASTVAAQANALDQGTSALQAAVPVNTPAAG